MARNIQQPTREPGGVCGDKITHPAFATISAHRISGGFHLFGSNVGHSGCVAIELTEATMNDDGHHQRVFGGSRVIAKAYMSEAQWVAFVSRMNIGSGTPCTLQYMRDGDLVSVPDLPNPEKPAERLESNARSMLAESQRKQTEAADRLLSLIADLKVSGAAKELLRKELSFVIDHGQANRDYQEKVLAEVNEDLVKDAKVEIDAMVTSLVQQLGVESLQHLSQVASGGLRLANG